MSSVPEDIGDAMCHVHDAVMQLAPGASDITSVLRGRERDISGLERDILGAGVVDGARVDVDSTESSLIALFALDRVLARANPELSSSAAAEPVAHLLERVERTGRFSDRADGALLAKRCASPRPGPPDRVRAAVTSVVRVSREKWASVDHVLVPHLCDLDASIRRTGLRAGTMTFVDDMAQFDLRELTVDGGSCGYRLAPNADLVNADHVDHAMRALTESSIEIGVLPEGVWSDDLGPAWDATLTSTSFGDSLRWVIPGTGPSGVGETDPPPNRAWLIDHVTGRAVTHQDKRLRFTLTDYLIRDYCLEDELPGPEGHEEDIHAPARLAVIESSVGRFAVLICEDLNGLMDDAELLLQVGATHVIVPIFSKEIVQGDWTCEGAGRLASDVGSTVLVLNSAAVENRRRERGIHVDPWASAFVVGPRMGGGAVYAPGLSHAPHDVVAHRFMAAD